MPLATIQYKNFQNFLENENVMEKGEEFLSSQNFAHFLDLKDPIRHLRSEFYYPKSSTLPNVDMSLIKDANEDSVYLCGNSLGLLPRPTEEVLAFHMRKWAKTGVFGHFAEPEPWVHYDERLLEQLAELVGAKSADEVGLMNGLTVNIHVLFTSFYQPTDKRHKILIESKAFPSDHYALESQIRLHGRDPADSLICLKPRNEEHTLRTEDILQTINEQGDEIAIVFFSSIQFYTGQLFEMEKISQAAKAKGCFVGWDCAHSFANVPLELHKWNVDFACWCTYKYGCTGAGGIGGIFINSRYAHDFERLRLQGWWSHRISTRFQMTNQMELDDGVRGFRTSCTPFMLIAAMDGSLKVFAKTSMSELRQKSILLTGYLEFLIDRRLGNSKTKQNSGVHVEIITPRNAEHRGCQLSLKFNCDIKLIFAELVKRGIATDVRYPNVIRVAPVHLYNSFDDCWRFVDRLIVSIRTVNSVLDVN